VWTTACDYDHLIPGRGVGVLLDDGSQAALFRLDDGSVRAVGNVDPFSGAACCPGGSSVTAMVAPRSIADPQTGFPLDDVLPRRPRVSVPVYPARVTPEGRIQVARIAG